MKFKESSLVKNHKILTGTKRDMRKKVVKSTTPTSDLKKPTTLKRQLGGNIFTTYNSIAPYEGPVFEQPVATVEIKELPISRLETNRQNVMAKAEEKKEEPVVEEKVNTEPLPTSKEETPVVENKESAPINIKSKDEFIKTMTPAFENALKARGLDTKYAKYLVAQSALESNWGKSQSGKFNFGGIKGKGTIRKTREVINGKSIHVNDSFRDFKDINDYANYHVSLLNNKRYQAFSGGDFIDRVVKGGYATDPNYKKALSNVYNQIAKAQVGMKIPKLQNAGELKARILRRFRQEKLDAHNEELIGFDWSRYKSYKPKPETTPTQSEQLENGGVIKAQDGIIAQAINKVKSFLPKEEPKEPINVVDIIKEYAPSAATSFLSGSVNPFINKLLEGKKSSLDYSHKFGSTGNKFEEFASVMTPIFKEALEENGLPITNLNNLVRQAALESNYGLDPRGERGFNLSGIKHPGDSIAPKYKKSRYKDGFDYIDFDNLKDYANYKVKVLNDRYKALDAKDTNDFIDRLHGNNSGKYNYSADKDSYRRNLNGTLSLNKYLKRGGIIKYQNPSSGIQRRDAIKDYRPQIQEPIKQQYTPTYSEISQDNRSEWEKSQSREKADKAYKDYMQAKNTEEGLHNLNGFLTFTDYVGLGTGVGSIIGRGLKYAGKQAIKRATKNKMLKELGEDYTNRLIRALGDKKQPTPISSVKFGNMTSRFAEYLKQQGVDISQFTDRDLLNLMSLRNESVNGNLPELGRFTLVSESKNGGVPIYQSELYSGKDNIIGNLSGTITSKDLKVNSVSKTNPKINAERGVSEDLYNSAIQYAKQQGYGGVRTGDLLQSPEITYKVWDKFSNKELIGTFGEHSFNFGETIKNPELRSKTILDGNVYRLTTPTRFVPTKNQFMFHPSIVDSKTGKLNPPRLE